MVIRLQPDQVAAMWEVIKFGAIQANRIPKEQEESFLTNILAKALDGSIQVWILYDYSEPGEAQKDFYAFALTCMVHDPVFNVDYFTVHTLYALRPMTYEIMHEGIEAVVEFARLNNIPKIVAFTYDSRIAKIFDRFEFKQDILVYTREV
jgi:hypothetical protein